MESWCKMLTTEDREMECPATDDEKPFDPYLYHAEMPLTADFYPLGFPVQLTTNSTEVVEAAEESWGSSRKQFEVSPLRLHIGVLDDGSTECPPAPVSRA